jgi:transcription elongation factor GreA
LFTKNFNRLNDQPGLFTCQNHSRLPWDINASTTRLSSLPAALLQDHKKNNAPAKRIELGHKVTLFDVQANEICTLVLVEPRISDPAKNQISCFSPLGRQLLGCTLGDLIEVKVFYRTEMFQVINIEN